ncbi:MAG: TerB family tellurite resistance protein [Alphaproteobacteria bacterium]|nr:TerB family tellurite resistance protein [Alphaproteobacteria bacterium]
MAFLLGIVGVLGTAAVVLWRIKMAADATRDIAEAAGDARKFVRRTRWKSRQKAGQKTVPDDPRSAATAMMAAVAEVDGALMEAETAAILKEIAIRFELSPADADELFAEGRWLSKYAGDLSSFLRRMEPPIRTGCTEQERRDLIEMLSTVAGCTGPADPIAAQAIETLRRSLGVA